MFAFDWNLIQKAFKNFQILGNFHLKFKFATPLKFI